MNWQIVAVVIGIITLYSAIVIWAVKVITRLAMSSYDRRLDLLERKQAEHESENLVFREQLPERYMLKADWSMFRDQVLLMTSLVDQKLDILLGRIPGGDDGSR